MRRAARLSRAVVLLSLLDGQQDELLSYLPRMFTVASSYTCYRSNYKMGRGRFAAKPLRSFSLFITRDASQSPTGNQGLKWVEPIGTPFPGPPFLQFGVPRPQALFPCTWERTFSGRKDRPSYIQRRPN